MTRDISQWYDISARSYAEVMICSSGPWGVIVPADITWPRIAICDGGQTCVEFAIDP